MRTYAMGYTMFLLADTKYLTLPGGGSATGNAKSRMPFPSAVIPAPISGTSSRMDLKERRDITRHNSPMGTFLRNSALSSGREVLMYIPVPSSKPAALVNLGTMARYQWKYFASAPPGDSDRIT